MNKVARDFLTRCFAAGSAIALLLRAESPAKTQQRVVTLEQALAPRYLAWLDYENRNGANVYVAANPLLPGSRRRTKVNIASVRHLYLDLDTDGSSRLAALRASEAVPQPSAVISTSVDKYQVLWRVDGLNFTEQEHMLKILALTYGGDPACTDCNRVLRIPGFLNRKYDPASMVTVEYGATAPVSPEDFRLSYPAIPTLVSAGRNGRGVITQKQSTSEADWGWVCNQLSSGEDGGKLTRRLADRRSDKPNPVYYAQRTVDVASARLWLLEGAPIDDVISMLEVRRRYELPDALCSARAREIAATAQRMIHRRKIA